MVLKPVQGMGAKSTFRIRNVGQLLTTLNSLGVGVRPRGGTSTSRRSRCRKVARHLFVSELASA
ncbi:MAG: hypothetical protein MUC96_32935, partial [Myxococcaceae bacterium]|nr:hypothetical protein [Myxococcaceae bacterium]